MSVKPSEDSSGASSSNLQRGRACLNCRRLKMRCDGVRPVCGQCLRVNKTDDCEYMSGQARSRIQILEEDISRVEARIYELEHPEETPSSVQLHNPYGVVSSWASTQGHKSPLSQTVQVVSIRSSQLPSSNSWWTSGEPVINDAQSLVDSFLLYASEFGFFLDPVRFRIAALHAAPAGHSSRPAPSVLFTVYLLGAHLARSSSQSLEQNLLPSALHETATALSNNQHPQRIVHALQSEILLAHYFFAYGRFLEGKYHVSAAISISVSSALNKIRTERPDTSALSLLGPPRDSIEEGERIRAFWSAFILDQSWAVALGAPPNVAYPSDVPAVQIDTPWPLEIQTYEQGLLPLNLGSIYTVEKFLRDPLDGTEAMSYNSPLAMHAKAALLWYRAYDLAHKWKPNMPREEANIFNASFVQLDNTINRFRKSLIALDQLRHATQGMTRTILVAHSICYAATIQLHSTFVHGSKVSESKRLTAAQTILGMVAAVSLREFAYINPIMGTVWVSASQVLIDKIHALKARAYSDPRHSEENLISMLEHALVAMSRLSDSCPLMRYQLAQIQEAYVVCQ